MINRAEIKVTLEHDALTVIGKSVERKSFASELEDAKMPTEYDIMKTLHDIANTGLYTVNTKASIDKTIDYAEKNIETESNRALLADLTREIRANRPFDVIQQLQLSMCQKEALFGNVARIKRLLPAPRGRSDSGASSKRAAERDDADCQRIGTAARRWDRRGRGER